MSISQVHSDIFLKFKRIKPTRLSQLNKIIKLETKNLIDTVVCLVNIHSLMDSQESKEPSFFRGVETKISDWYTQMINSGLSQRRSVCRSITDLKYILGDIEKGDELFLQVDEFSKLLRNDWSDNLEATFDRKFGDTISEILSIARGNQGLSDQLDHTKLSPREGSTVLRSQSKESKHRVEKRNAYPVGVLTVGNNVNTTKDIQHRKNKRHARTTSEGTFLDFLNNHKTNFGSQASNLHNNGSTLGTNSRRFESSRHLPRLNTNIVIDSSTKSRGYVSPIPDGKRVESQRDLSPSYTLKTNKSSTPINYNTHEETKLLSSFNASKKGWESFKNPNMRYSKENVHIDNEHHKKVSAQEISSSNWNSFAKMQPVENQITSQREKELVNDVGVRTPTRYDSRS